MRLRNSKNTPGYVCRARKQEPNFKSSYRITSTSLPFHVTLLPLICSFASAWAEAPPSTRQVAPCLKKWLKIGGTLRLFFIKETITVLVCSLSHTKSFHAYLGSVCILSKRLLCLPFLFLRIKARHEMTVFQD